MTTWRLLSLRTRTLEVQWLTLEHREVYALAILRRPVAIGELGRLTAGVVWVVCRPRFSEQADADLEECEALVAARSRAEVTDETRILLLKGEERGSG
jgi:hypothetical protein